MRGTHIKVSARQGTLILRLTKLVTPWLLLFIAACGPAGPALTASDIKLVAPLPGRTFSAAYLTLHNRGNDTVTIRRVSSSHFSRVEIHESLVVDDVVRMSRLDSLVIDSGERVKFESGGKHLMLIEPQPGIDVGDSITLWFEYDDDGLLIVDAPLGKRE